MEYNQEQTASLFKVILSRVTLLTVLVVVAASAGAYWYIFKTIETKELSNLSRYVAGRIREDNAIFELAADNLRVFKEEYLNLYRSELLFTKADFEEFYFVDSEGATRMKREYFDGIFTDEGSYIYGMSSFIGNNQPTDAPDLQRRLLLAYQLISRLGPAWTNRFANLHTSFPENAIVLFWPQEPWGLNAQADLPMNELGVIRQTLVEENPGRIPVWTGLYFDETAEEWMITYEVPLDLDGKHLLNPSHDVYLTDMMERLLTDQLEGSYNFIIREDGFLVAYPGDIEEDNKWLGQLSLDEINDPEITDLYYMMKSSGVLERQELVILENRKYSAYVAAGPFSGPNWWFVTVYPKKIIRQVANSSAGIVLILGTILLFLFILVVYVVIKTHVARPLALLRDASLEIAEGNYDVVPDNGLHLPRHKKTEVDILAEAFGHMAARSRDMNKNLERIVHERTRELEEANRKLLDLSLLDGLTGIHNRRSFDRDLEKVFCEAKAGKGRFTLLMADVDHFKAYNDRYGHNAGDEILKTIGRVLTEAVRQEDRVYRYGGEEFTIIFGHADESVAGKIAPRILEEIRALRKEHESSPLHIVTISCGISEYRAEYQTPEELIINVDAKLYASKENGRNRITL